MRNKENAFNFLRNKLSKLPLHVWSNIDRTFEIELDEGGLGKPFEVEKLNGGNSAILPNELFALVHILGGDNTNGLENL